MNYETVIIERKGHIGVLTLNRPEVRNAFNVQLMEDILAALEELEADSEVRAIIVKGAGPRAFSAGRDMSELIGKTILEYRDLFRGVGQIMEAIATMGKPVIGAVHGYALAGGCGLAAACDLVVASDDAIFGTPEINVGLFPMTVMAAISRSLERKKCLEFLLSGDTISAQEAERIGLVNKVVPREKLEEAALELAEKLASKSPAVLQLGKQAFYTMSDMEYSKAIRYLGEMIAITAASEDAKEGMTAFFEKRPPQWKGR